MRKQNLFCFVVIILLFHLNIESGVCQQKEPTRDNLYETIELFTDAITIIQSEYVDEVKHKDLIYGALKGMLSSLDPYSQFMDPDTYNEMKVDTEGKFGGIGIEITIKDGLLTIITPIDDTPAYKVGIKAGDKIVKINGELTKDITLIEAVKKLRGDPGTQVTITILREDEEKLIDYTITRDIIKIASVKEAKIIEGTKIGYIRIVEFRENTPEDLEEFLLNLEKEGMNGLILDLRNNPGGLLNIAVEVGSKFIENGKIIVFTKGRIENQNLEFKSREENTHISFPLVVLVNNGSASGSEIVAGAIQDYKRGIILGTKTFGKGLVQTIVPLNDGSAIRLSTSKYYTPLGRSIHGEGVIPDVIVEPLEIELLPVAKKPEEIFEKVKEGVVPESELKEDKKVEKYDNQLARAVDLLKGIEVYKQFIIANEISNITLTRIHTNQKPNWHE